MRRARNNGGRQLPRATLRFWRRAWLHFEHALDPLGRPRPLPVAKIRPLHGRGRGGEA
jgi:hypothetical protein